MDNDRYSQAISNIKQQAVSARHRRLVVLSGDRSWAEPLACDTLNNYACESVMWLTDRPAAAELFVPVKFIPAKKALRHLGGECDFIVMDAYAGFHPDGFGAISGTLKAGGLFILIAPALEQWSSYDDPDYERITSLPFQRENLSRRFIQRIKKAITSENSALLIEQGKPILDSGYSDKLPGLMRDANTINDECITPDQQKAVEAVSKVLTGHRRRPLVLNSDRGRGKSASLGIAAAKLIKNGASRIILTAPYPEAVESAFSRLEALFPLGERDGLTFHCYHIDNERRAEVKFMAPDELLANSPDADLVMVDEAAAIPAPMLERLLKRYSRIVFASTIHGYEGTGRGFAVRFTKVLDRISPQWHSLYLKAPIRWSENDPLEQFVFDALLLNASPIDPCLQGRVTMESITLQWLNRDSLSQDESLLNQVFGLLVLAHYRTSPDDLRMMLDSPSTRIAVLFDHSNDMRVGSTVIAVALVVREGSLEPELGELIWQGQRRPRGHLIPQALSSFNGFKEACALKGDRVMRIAVHPRLHQQGFGSYLINAIKDDAKKACLDYVGVSFGATPELVHFWEVSGFYPLRVGFQREAASGAHSVIMFSAVSGKGLALYHKARKRFYKQFLFDLSDVFSDLDCSLVVSLLRDTDNVEIVLCEQDSLDLLAFSEYQRMYECCSLSVWALVVWAVQKDVLIACCNTLEVSVLVRRVLQKRSAVSVVSEFTLKGKKELNSVLASGVKSLLCSYSTLSQSA